MPRYLVSFDNGWMDFPEEDFETVAKDAHDVMFAAQAAGVWVTGGGFPTYNATLVDVDGTQTKITSHGMRTPIGGFSIIEVPNLEEALVWAAKIAKACRCKQEVREFLDDPDV